MEEAWRDIPEYKGIYQISNFGRVKTTGRKVTSCDGRILNIKAKILKNQKNKLGYPLISITFEKKVRTFMIHRLVAESFVENPRGLTEVNHIDGNRMNARWDNLEWVTRSENCIHKVEVLRHYGRFDDKPRGVFFDKSIGAYKVYFSYQKKKHYLGSFKKQSEAFRTFYEKFKEIRGHEPWDLEKYKTH